MSSLIDLYIFIPLKAKLVAICHHSSTVILNWETFLVVTVQRGSY